MRDARDGQGCWERGREKGVGRVKSNRYTREQNS